MPNTTTRHYLLLDGLRGVAALLVLLFHLFEAVAFAAGRAEQDMFHGFLAVDFFLILSGFVMSYAYDGRWGEMSVGAFFRRRLIRLHPMVVAGVVFGAVVFVAQGSVRWDGTQVPWIAVVSGVLLALLLLPSPLELDVRGNTEMFPLNGPHWSLFFEYLFNVLYALLLRRFSTRVLKIWVVCAAAALLGFTVWGPEGTIGCGWSSSPGNMLGGLLRVAVDYPMGLLLARLFHSRRHSAVDGRWLFVVCSVLLALLFAVPSLGAANVFYELFCMVVVFPLIVWFAARGVVKEGGVANRSLAFLADISYPLYAIHYPLIYLYIGWINADVHPFGTAVWATPLALTAIAILLAYLLMRCYDKPLRRWLSRRG